MAKRQETDFLDRLKSDIDDVTEEDDDVQRPEPKKEDEKPKKVSSITIGGKEVPVSEIPSVIENLSKDNATQKEAFESFRTNLLGAISGKKAEEDESFDEIEFLANTDYRKKYLNDVVQRLVKEETKGLNQIHSNTTQEIGKMKYTKIKSDLVGGLEDSGVDFDYDKHENEINEIVMSTFNPALVQQKPYEVITYAINQILKKSGQDAVNIPTERPSTTTARGKPASSADEIRSRIKNATQDGVEPAPEGNPFGF